MANDPVRDAVETLRRAYRMPLGPERNSAVAAAWQRVDAALVADSHAPASGPAEGIPGLDFQPPRDRTPSGYTRVEAYMGRGYVVVMGQPTDESHSCDEMGCGSTGAHVVARVPLPTSGPAAPADEVCRVLSQGIDEDGCCVGCGRSVPPSPCCPDFPVWPGPCRSCYSDAAPANDSGAMRELDALALLIAKAHGALFIDDGPGSVAFRADLNAARALTHDAYEKIESVRAAIGAIPLPPAPVDAVERARRAFIDVSKRVVKDGRDGGGNVDYSGTVSDALLEEQDAAYDALLAAEASAGRDGKVA